MTDVMDHSDVIAKQIKITADKVNKRIPLVEMFGPTIQGEGTVLGQQTYFLRFGLCDYECKMCDSLHAVIPAHVKKNAKWLTQQEIYDDFVAFHKPNTTKWVTFSGGNPAIHELSYLVGLLRLGGFKINVETQGTMYHEWLNKVDSLTISPKGPGMGETHNNDVFMGFIGKVHENSRLQMEDAALPWFVDICVKIVAFDQRDLEFAAEIFHNLMNHDLFLASDISNQFYISLGNPNPPQPADNEDNNSWLEPEEHIALLLNQYRNLYEDIQHHPILSQVRFTPQWHVFVWGNSKGK